MQIEVNMKKSGRWVEASVPAVRVYTQGKSFKDAAAMVVDAVELLADTYGIKAKASVKRTPRNPRNGFFLPSLVRPRSGLSPPTSRVRMVTGFPSAHSSILR